LDGYSIPEKFVGTKLPEVCQTSEVFGQNIYLENYRILENSNLNIEINQKGFINEVHQIAVTLVIPVVR